MSDLTGEGPTSQRTVLVEPAGCYLSNFCSILILGGGGVLIVGFASDPIYGVLLALALARPAFRQH